jgi:hypothetical protein
VKLKKKNRWATAKGKTVSVRFSDADYGVIKKVSESKNMSPGEYLRWLFRLTGDGAFTIEKY